MCEVLCMCGVLCVCVCAPEAKDRVKHLQSFMRVTDYICGYMCSCLFNGKSAEIHSNNYLQMN